ncbi:MAG: GT-D fold domain-containing protein [Lachnospiraceae bacterium]|nr:GT-D fold domain-containing protein [Lachnospiraceae bacterium]
MTEQEIQILESMLDRIEKCEETNRLLLDSNKALLRSNQVLSESLENLRREYEHFTENVTYESNDPVRSGELFYPRIKTIDETIAILLSGKKSLCRFGDGEFACISGNLRASFTTSFNRKLAERLKEVLESSDNDIMIAIADNYGDLSEYLFASRREIRSYMTETIRKEHYSLLDPDRDYYNAYITRPYMFLQGEPVSTKEYWDKIRTLWDNKDVVIIEGANTGMGVGNDLLENCKSIKRIVAPAIDAFDKYEEIIKETVKQPQESLYLAALGPAATVLAYDLAKSGRRAIDIGHLDIEYEWMKRGEYRVTIPGKYVNEVVGGTSPEAIHDSDYEKQIIARIG